MADDDVLLIARERARLDAECHGVARWVGAAMRSGVGFAVVLFNTTEGETPILALRTNVPPANLTMVMKEAVVLLEAQAEQEPKPS